MQITKWLAAVFRIPASEVSKTLSFILLFFFRGAVVIVGPSIALGVFNIQVGPEQLSVVYTFYPLFTLPISLLVFLGLRYFAVNSIVSSILFFTSLVYIFNAGLLYYLLLVNSTHLISYSYLILSCETITQVLGSVLWVMASFVCTTQVAKSIFSLIVGGYMLGCVTGSFALRLLSSYLPLPIFFLGCGVCLLAGLLVSLWIGGRYQVVYEDEDIKSKEPTFHEYVQYLRSSKYWIPIVSIAFGLYTLFYLANFEFQIIATNYFKNKKDLISFYGFFNAILSVTLFFSSIFVFKKMIEKLGIWNNLVYCTLVITSFFFLLFFFPSNLYAATIGKILVQIVAGEFLLILLSIIYKPAHQFSNNLMAFSNDFSTIGGMFVCGCLGQILNYNLLSFSSFSLIIGLFSLLLCAWTMYAKGSYVMALARILTERSKFATQNIQAELNEGRFTEQLPILISAMQSHDAEIQKTALKIPVKIDYSDTIQYFLLLIRALDDEDHEIRGAAILSLSQWKEAGDLLVPYLEKKLEDPDPKVQENALRAIYEVVPDRALAKVRNFINQLINEGSPHKICLAIKIIGDLKLKEWDQFITAKLYDADSETRVEAIRTLGLLGINNEPELISMLKPLIDDPDAHVADQVFRVFANIGLHHKEMFVDELLSSNIRTWKKAAELFVLWKDSSYYPLLTASASLNIVFIYESLLAISIIKDFKNSDISLILIKQLRNDIETILSTSFHILSLTIDEVLVKSIHHNLQQSNEHVKGHALEALENLGNSHLIASLKRYFICNTEEERVEQAKLDLKIDILDYRKALVQMLYSADEEWIIACALYLIGELKDHYFIDFLHALSSKTETPFIKNNIELALYKINRVEDKREKEFLLFDRFMIKLIFFKTNILFSQIPLDGLLSIMSDIEELTVDPDHAMISENEPVDFLYFFVQGRADIIFNGLQEQFITIKSLSAGDCVGESVFFDSMNSPYGVRIIEQSTFYAIKKVKCIHYSRKWQELWNGIIQHLCTIHRQCWRV